MQAKPPRTPHTLPVHTPCPDRGWLGPGIAECGLDLAAACTLHCCGQPLRPRGEQRWSWLGAEAVARGHINAGRNTLLCAPGFVREHV